MIMKDSISIDNEIMNSEVNQKIDTESYLNVNQITKMYGNTLAVENIDFSIGQGEMVTLLGPSGCGKSTILRCVAGLEKINSGQIIIDVFQDFGENHAIEMSIRER